MGWSRLVVLLALASGCVRIDSRIRYEQKLERTRRSVETVEDSRVAHAVAPEVRGTTLQVRLESRERCRQIATPVYRKHAYEERFVAVPTVGISPGYAFAFGALGIGAGAYSYQAAEYLAAEDMSAEPSTPDDYRTAGITLAAVGAVLASVAIVDWVRLRDRDYDAGLVNGDPDTREVACHREPLAETEIVASVGRWNHVVTSNKRGEVEIDFETLPEDAFSGSSLTVALGNDIAPVEVTLDADTTAALLLALAGDPSSQIARTREARAQRACDEAAAAARAARVDIDTDRKGVEAAVEAWRDAKRTCGSRWTPAHETDARAFETQLAATATARATRQCSAAAAEAQRAFEPDERIFEEDAEPEPLDLGELRAALASACEGATNASGVLSAFDRSVAAQQRREAARRRLVEGARQADRYLAENNAVGVWTTFQKHPGLGPIARRSAPVKRELVRVTTHWIHALERDHASSSTHRQVCAGRRLVTAYVGSAEWSALRVAAVKRSSVTNGTKLARLLDGGVCQ